MKNCFFFDTKPGLQFKKFDAFYSDRNLDFVFNNKKTLVNGKPIQIYVTDE